MRLSAKSLLLLIFFVVFGFAQTDIEKDAEEKRNLGGLNGKTIIKSTVPDASGGEDSSTWNIKDWQNHNGATTDGIGNTQATLQSLPGSSLSITGNPDAVNSENIKLDENLKNEPSLTAFSDDVINGIISSTTSKADTADLFSSTIKCYITRDVPIRYRCEHTQLVYGDGINSDGYETKNRCENECYEQYDAVEITPAGSLDDIAMAKISLETPTKEQLEEDILVTDAYLNSDDYSKRREMVEAYLRRDGESTIIVDEIHVLSTVSFSAKVTNGKSAYLTLKYVNKDGVEINYMNNFRITGETTKEFALNEVVKKVSILVYTLEEDTSVDIDNISLNYKGGEYICPHFQDISSKKAGEFAYLCPSGNTKTVSAGFKNYVICEDYGTVGDNLDGTYSKREMANSICKKNYSCKMDISVMNTEILKGFREGCIEGQADCDENLCKKLRVEKNPIIHENVFDAGQHPKKTIISESQVKGVKRPRVLLREDLSFLERTAEELKDEAYKNMLDEKTFSVAAFNIEENTNESSAYAIGISGTNLYSGSTKRALYWVLKPKAFDYKTKKKFYSVFDVAIRREVVQADGSAEFYKDRIIYLKLNEGSDTLKPIARKKDWGKDVEVIDENGLSTYKHYELETSVWKYQSFNESTKKWYTHSSELSAEYFKNEELIIDEKPFLRIPIISDIANLVYKFPGVVTSIVKDGPYEYKNYGGAFDGTGETIIKVLNYDFVEDSNTPITYSRIIEMIENKEIEPIYSSLNFGKMSKSVQDDTGKVGAETQLYLYGKKEKKTGFVRLFPKNADIGKNGFIYIFAIEE